MSGNWRFLKYGIKGKSTWYIAHCPLLSRCPLFGVCAKRGFTVLCICKWYAFFIAPAITITFSHATKLTVCVVLFMFCFEFSIIGSVLHTLCCFQTQNGFSPVYVANQKCHSEVVDLLVQAGANIYLAADEVYTCYYTHSAL